MSPRQASRVLTVFAVGFLTLDAVLLILAGVWSRRVELMVWGAGLGVIAVGVWRYWRYHVRRMAELRADLDSRKRAFHLLQRDLDQDRRT